MEKKTHVISLLVEDQFGALQRVAGVFTRRGFNMDTITAGKSETTGISRITITTTGDDATLEKITKQLHKLVEVIKVQHLHEKNSVAKEVALAKIHVKDTASRTELMNFVEIFKAKVVDVSKNTLMVEITGERDKVESFLEVARPFGIRELARTGITALERDR